MTAQNLSGRLGLAPRTVEGLREELRRQGLLTSERRGQRIHWLVALPPDCVPATTRPADQEVSALAQRLDQILRNGHE